MNKPRRVRKPSSAGRVRYCGKCNKVLKKQNSTTGYCSGCYQEIYIENKLKEKHEKQN